METALRVTTTVQPGNKIEIADPELIEGAQVEVTIVMHRTPQPALRSILDFLDSLPPGPRSYSTWEEFERRFQEERNSWER